MSQPASRKPLSAGGLSQLQFCCFQLDLCSVFKETTAEYACTRKQFNKKLSDFGLIQVIKNGTHSISVLWVRLECEDTDCAGGLLALLI